MPYNAKQHEEEVLNFWNEDKTFEKSVNERPEDKPFVFYDGPPFATGLPHYGHIVPGAMKDAMPRYKTMRGFRVERRWGWDCHGLPIENIVEKELDLPGKKEIEAFGIDKFNEACRSKVLMYADEWKRIMPRLGRWVDMSARGGSAKGGDNDNYASGAYMTMDLEYMESVWWVFSELWKKGLVYEGKKPMHICPRCATPLSNFEVTQGYKDIKDLSVTAQFKIKSEIEGLDAEGDVYMLAWTTTPWTLPGNVLLAVGADLDYVVVHHEESHYIVAKDLAESVFDGKEYSVVKEIKGSDLVGLMYEPLFPYFTEMEGAENAFRVLTADFVTTEEGTGIVHLAPAFGTDDYEVFRQENVPFIQHVTIDGRFIPEVTDFAGQEVKQRDDHMATDVDIVKYLAKSGGLFSKKKYEHSYPHCWRCDTPLLNYATSSWFVEVTKMKQQLLKNNKAIHWVPENVKEGRFGKWLEGVRDWAVSRNRYWGTPLPVWKSDDGDVLCIGSVEELEALSGEKVADLHKHFVDKIVIEKDGKTYRRIEEVFDCWFESGSMPYGQAHYPFENKEKFEAQFPADFIAEGADQTRGWFYTLHVLATALTSGDKPSIPATKSSSAFKHVVVNGIVLAEDGKKMSKRLKNYPDPMEIVDKYGADALRLYLLSAPVVQAESLNFSETGVREVYNKVCNTLWNVVSFYEMFSEELETRNLKLVTSDHALDRWIVARLNQLNREVTEGMEAYKFVEATRPIQDFVLDLSQWYVRRSRDRFKHGTDEDKQAALSTLRYVLMTLSKVMAPFTPFIAEKTYKLVTRNLELEVSSVHLTQWPECVEASEGERRVLEEMRMVRKVVEMGMSLRKEHGVRVRQPLAQLGVEGVVLSDDLKQLIADELNVKTVANEIAEYCVAKADGLVRVGLDTNLTDELKQEGLMRELVRAINQLRKEQGLTREHRIRVVYKTDDGMLKRVFTTFEKQLQTLVLADALEEGSADHEVSVGSSTMFLSVEAV